MESDLGLLLTTFVVLLIALVSLGLATQRDNEWQKANPSKLGFTWGYFVIYSTMIGWILTSAFVVFGTVRAEATDKLLIFFGIFAVFIGLAYYALRRRKWALILYTILSLNVLWMMINIFYLRNRWAEFAEEQIDSSTPEGQFSEEWIFRTFVVLQAAGVIGIVYIDATTPSYDWSFLPDSYRGLWRLDLRLLQRDWDLLQSRQWGNYYNWYALAFLFGPICLAKSIDWIVRANRDTSTGGSPHSEPNSRENGTSENARPTNPDDRQEATGEVAEKVRFFSNLLCHTYQIFGWWGAVVDTAKEHPFVREWQRGPGNEESYDFRVDDPDLKEFQFRILKNDQINNSEAGGLHIDAHPGGPYNGFSAVAWIPSRKYQVYANPTTKGGPTEKAIWLVREFKAKLNAWEPGV